MMMTVIITRLSDCNKEGTLNELIPSADNPPTSANPAQHCVFITFVSFDIVIKIKMALYSRSWQTARE